MGRSNGSSNREKARCISDGEGDLREITGDGTVDFHGRPAIRSASGRWTAGAVILLNQGLATLAFFGVGVNLVLYLTRVLQQSNAEAANNVSKWTGTVYIFSLVGAFLSDSYWGRYKTCAIFQAIFVAGLGGLSVASSLFLIRPKDCGDRVTKCGPHSSWETALFYISIYMIALGNGGYQPNIATFGADQFDVQDVKEQRLKVAFFSYFYLALNLGSLFSNTILSYYEDEGFWALGFWASTGSAFVALVLFLCGTKTYRHFKPSGNPLSRFCQVLVAATKKWNVELQNGEENLFDDDEKCCSTDGSRKILHTDEFRFLDKAAFMTPEDFSYPKQGVHNPWSLCPISQVEEVKCILRLLPIWLCTILYSVVFTQMASLFVEQGAAMRGYIAGFPIPASSMSSFDILSVAICIILYRKVINPLARKFRKTDDSKGLTELQRMGIGLIIAVMAMVAAGIVECFRLKYARTSGNTSSLSIFWQVPQYALIGASEVFMYVGQLEFFNAQAPDGLKSFGSALCMTSISLGNYVSSFIVTIVMKISTEDHMPGWIPGNLNRGHLDRFYFLLAGLTAIDFGVYIVCAKWYKSIKLKENSVDQDSDESGVHV